MMRALLPSLLVAATVLIFSAAENQDGPMLLLATFKFCDDLVKPSGDDLALIAEGKASSSPKSVAMITCILKGTSVMQDKKYNATSTTMFLSALTPGGDQQTKAAMFSELSEKCSSVIAPEPNATDEDVAMQIYYCLMKEGSAMNAGLEGMEKPKN